MQITRIEFVLLVAVFSGVIIFCPEALVLLRNLCIWGLITWTAWYGYEQWAISAWARQFIQSLVQARSLTDVAALLLGESTSAGVEWVNNKASYASLVCSRVWADFSSRCRYFLGLKQGTPSDSSANPPPSTATPGQTSTELPSTSTPSTPRVPKYYAIFVTKPPIHRYGEFSDGFCTPEDKPRPIQWDVTSNESIPPLIPSLKFRRHWGFVLIEDGVWEDKSLTLVQKLSCGLCWDHCGDEKQEKSVRQYKLRCDYIRKFNGIHNLGIITDSRDAVNRCSSFYDQLSSKWDYLNTWWNDADFAIILAFLTVGDDITAECAQLLILLAQLRHTDVLAPRYHACQTNTRAGFAVGFGASALTFVTAGAAGPLLLPTIALSMGSMGWGGGAARLGEKLMLEEGSRYERRRQYLGELRARFPQLQKLLLASKKSLNFAFSYT